MGEANSTRQERHSSRVQLVVALVVVALLLVIGLALSRASPQEAEVVAAAEEVISSMHRRDIPAVNRQLVTAVEEQILEDWVFGCLLVLPLTESMKTARRGDVVDVALHDAFGGRVQWSFQQEGTQVRLRWSPDLECPVGVR